MIKGSIGIFLNLFAAIVTGFCANAAAALATRPKEQRKGSGLRQTFLILLAGAGSVFLIANLMVFLGVRMDGTQAQAPSPTPAIKTAQPTPTIRPRTLPQDHDVSRVSPEALFIKNYVAASPSASTGRRISIVLADDGETYTEIANAVTQVLREKGYEIRSIFHPAVRSGSAFDTLFSADPALNRSLEPYCDYLVVGKISSQMVKNSEFEDLLTGTVVVNAKIISTRTGAVEGEIGEQEAGAGYTAPDSRKSAEEKLESKIQSRLMSIFP